MLSQAHRRSIHTSLTPVLGEEETDALMSEFPLTEADMPATKRDLAVTTAHVDTTITELRHEMQLGFATIDTRIATIETKIEASINGLLKTMIIVVCSSLVGGMALSAGIAAGIAQAVGGG